MQVSKITLFGGGKTMVTLDLTLRLTFKGISRSIPFFQIETPTFYYRFKQGMNFSHVNFDKEQLLFQTFFRKMFPK